MDQTWLVVVTAGCAIAAAVVGGVFFAFSSFVMRALATLPVAQGIAAMQSINVYAVTPAFMTALFGTAVACLMLLVLGVLQREEPAFRYLAAGSAAYLVGGVVVTVFFNVPRNDRLAALDPPSAEGSRYWTDYVRTWTAWNHVRTVTCVLAAALLTAALFQ
jgi:uncharacterized membrane protein